MRSTLLRVFAFLNYTLNNQLSHIHPQSQTFFRTMGTVSHSSPLRAPPAWAANFPSSTARQSRLFQFPGVTPESTATVRRILEENDRGYDMYYRSPRYAHNHCAHSTLARYALGAPPDLLQADWESERTSIACLDPHEGGRGQDVPNDMPEQLTRENWADPRWWGKQGSYSRYLPFFHAEVARLGPKGAVEEYVFSRRANVGAHNEGATMIIGLMCGLVHPLIHVGYGLEFDDPVVLAEGLAQTCLHSPEALGAAYPAGWPHTPFPPPKGESKPLIQLYADFIQDDTLRPEPYDPNATINQRLIRAMTPPRVAAIQDLVARWDLSDMSDAGVAARFEEVAWLVTLLTGATSRPGYTPARFDFFLMHTLTSSIFIPSYMEILGSESRRNLLQAYLVIVFEILVARGRPHIFPDVAMNYSAHPTGGARFAKDGKLEALGNPTRAEEQNPWLEIVSNAIAFDESHVPKSIRSLVYFASKYGSKPPGAVPGSIVNGKEVLPGLGAVDGSLFVRVAGKMMESRGWVKEGASTTWWDTSALGWDEAWGEQIPARIPASKM